MKPKAARSFATVVWQELLRGASTGDALQRACASGQASASVDGAAYFHFRDPLDRPFSAD